MPYLQAHPAGNTRKARMLSTPWLSWCCGLKLSLFQSWWAGINVLACLLACLFASQRVAIESIWHILSAIKHTSWQNWSTVRTLQKRPIKSIVSKTSTWCQTQYCRTQHLQHCDAKVAGNQIYAAISANEGQHVRQTKQSLLRASYEKPVVCKETK